MPFAPGARSAARAFVLPLLAFLLLAPACGPLEGPETRPDLSSRPIRVVATIGMITEVAERVGGERVQVTGLMGAGIDPHTFRASERNVTDLAGADLVLFNGLHLEARMGELFERMQGRILAVAVSRGIPPERLSAPPEFEGHYDPHIWFDVRLWMLVVPEVAAALSELDPPNAAGYSERASAYLAELEDLDAWVREQAARVPEGQRVLITAHDAFNYFGRAYGFQVRGLQGISTATEAGTADVKELAAFIATRRIPAIFVESSVPRRNVEAVEAAVHALGFQVRIGGEIFSDAMGRPGTPEGTYAGMVRHNVGTIVGALLGE